VPEEHLGAASDHKLSYALALQVDISVLGNHVKELFAQFNVLQVAWHWNAGLPGHANFSAA